MGWKVAELAMRVLEVMFFTGMIGGVFIVALSWYQVGRDSFSKDDEG